MMNPEVLEILARDAVRLRQESLGLRANCEGMIRRSRELRLQRRALSDEHAQLNEASNRNRLHRAIGRKLRDGRLPRASAPVVHGAPGRGETCDACDRTLTSSQLALAVPMGDTVVHLHADCYVIWNEERATAKARSVA